MSKKSDLKVWDLPVRLMHWGLVLSVCAAWFTSGRTGPLHEYAGYCVATIAALRLIWGFAGSPYARFAQFVRRIATTLQYTREVIRGTAPRYIGHNPLGGWMVVALLTCTTLLVSTGLLYTTDMFWGYEWLANLHKWIAYVLVGLIALHVLGVVFSSWAHKENLVRAMLTGRKDAPVGNDVD